MYHSNKAFKVHDAQYQLTQKIVFVPLRAKRHKKGRLIIFPMVVPKLWSAPEEMVPRDIIGTLFMLINILFRRHYITNKA